MKLAKLLIVTSVGLIFLSFKSVKQNQYIKDQDFTQLLAKINNVFVETSKYGLSWKMTLASDKNYTQDIRQSSGQILKYNNFIYTEQDDIRKLATSRKQLVVDKSTKTIQYEHFVETSNNHLAVAKQSMLAQYLEYADSASTHYTSEGKLELILFMSRGAVEECTIRINPKTYFTEYSELKYVSRANENLVSYMKLDFDEVDLKPKLNKKKYNFSTYVKTLNTGVELTSDFEDFELIYIKK